MTNAGSYLVLVFGRVFHGPTAGGLAVLFRGPFRAGTGGRRPGRRGVCCSGLRRSDRSGEGLVFGRLGPDGGHTLEYLIDGFIQGRVKFDHLLWRQLACGFRLFQTGGAGTEADGAVLTDQLLFLVVGYHGRPGGATGSRFVLIEHDAVVPHVVFRFVGYVQSFQFFVPAGGPGGQTPDVVVFLVLVGPCLLQDWGQVLLFGFDRIGAGHGMGRGECGHDGVAVFTDGVFADNNADGGGLDGIDFLLVGQEGGLLFALHGKTGADNRDVFSGVVFNDEVGGVLVVVEIVVDVLQMFVQSDGHGVVHDMGVQKPTVAELFAGYHIVQQSGVLLIMGADVNHVGSGFNEPDGVFAKLFPGSADFCRPDLRDDFRHERGSFLVS